jgi:hypothetical protein
VSKRSCRALAPDRVAHWISDAREQGSEATSLDLKHSNLVKSPCCTIRPPWLYTQLADAHVGAELCTQSKKTALLLSTEYLV